MTIVFKILSNFSLLVISVLKKFFKLVDSIGSLSIPTTIAPASTNPVDKANPFPDDTPVTIMTFYQLKIYHLKNLMFNDY